MFHGREITFILLESADPLNGVVGAEFGRVGPAEPNARREATAAGLEETQVVVWVFIYFFLKDLGS